MSDPKGQAALDRAFKGENLLLLYQPIHDARTTAIVAAEALMRQRRQSGEVREASIITQAAEEGPDLFQFDSLTMGMAYTDAARWQARFDVSLNVNLSAREFQEGNVLPRLMELMSGCGIDTHKVNLEITETSYIKSPENTVQFLQELKKLGIALWLDDFGTGHSTIEHLLYFPLEGIKIPSTFVTGIPTNRRSTTITHALISLAQELELRVTAEGVETQDQLDFLRAESCDYIQGFLLSKPMRAEEFERLLERQAIFSSLPSSGQ